MRYIFQAVFLLRALSFAASISAHRTQGRLVFWGGPSDPIVGKLSILVVALGYVLSGSGTNVGALGVTTFREHCEKKI